MTRVAGIIVKGGVVMIPLLACSLVSLALTLERLILWGRIKSQQAVQDMLRLVEAGPVKKNCRPTCRTTESISLIH